MKSLATRRGQSTLEYAILIVVIVAGLIIMQGYVKRAMQGRLRSSSDDIGEQFSPGSLSGSLTTTTSRSYTENKLDGTTTTETTAQEQLTSGTVDMTTRLEDDLWDTTTPSP